MNHTLERRKGALARRRVALVKFLHAPYTTRRTPVLTDEVVQGKLRRMEQEIESLERSIGNA